MFNPVKRKVKQPTKREWDQAIAAARLRLGELQRLTVGLQRTIENWTRLRDQGMLWPGAESKKSATQN